MAISDSDSEPLIPPAQQTFDPLKQIESRLADLREQAGQLLQQLRAIKEDVRQLARQQKRDQPKRQN